TASAERGDRIALLLALDLPPRTIAPPGRISHRVAADPVRARLDDRRHSLPPRPLDRAPQAIPHGENVHAIDRLAGDPVGLGKAPDLGLAERAVDRRPHGVAVVLTDEDHRQLPERRQIEGLVELSLRHGAVAEEAQHDLVAALV